MLKQVKKHFARKHFAKNAKHLNEGNFKSQFLNSLIIRKGYKEPARERILKFLIFIVLYIGLVFSPWRKKAKKKEIVNDAYEKIIDPNFIFVPASFAFSMVMAFIPILSIILLIIGANPGFIKQIEELTSRVFGGLSSLIIQTSSFWSAFATSPTAFISVVITMFICAWIASSGFAKFVFSISLIYKHDRFGGFWMNRIRGMVIVFLVAVYLSGYVAVFSVINYGLGSSTFLREYPKLYSAVYWFIFIVYSSISLYFGFGLFYKFAPRIKLKWRHIHPGIIIAILPTFVFVLVFSSISNYALSYSATGGVLAFFMTLSMSLLIFSYFVYVGVIANAALYNTHVAKTTIRKRTVSKK